MEDLAIEEEVVLVDENNQVLGYVGKLEAHEKALLHRAISVIIFNSEGEMLIQQRAMGKYHWAGIWSNTCCSHPRKDESFQQAAERRLYEELGFHAPLKEAFQFIYKAFDKPSGLTEYEYDGVFIGTYDLPFTFNKSEVQAIKWISMPDLKQDLETHPEKYSFWFKIIIEELEKRGLVR